MRVRLGIQKKAVGGISLLLMLLGISLMSLSLYNDDRAIRTELLKRGRVAVDNLAYNAAYATLIGDSTALADFLDGVMVEKEVLYSFITDVEGQIMSRRVRASDGRSVVPASVDSWVARPGSEAKPGRTDAQLNEINLERIDRDAGVVVFRVPIRISRGGNLDAAGEMDLYGIGQTSGNASEAIEDVVGHAMIGMTTRYIDETIAGLRNKMIWITAIAIIVAMMITSIVVRLSLRPIEELAMATGRVAGGDYDVKVREGRNDEIGELAASFNKMTDDLKLSRNALVEKELLEELVVELRETQEQLVQAGKLAAVGQLAAGVAHEINNPMAGIMGYAQLLAEKMRRKQEQGIAAPEIPKLLSYVESMEKQSQRCKQIVQNLLKFARASSEADSSTVDCNQVLSETLSLITHQLDTNRIALVTDLQPGLPPVLGHEGKMQQIYTNIIINAMQAMEAGGTITATTSVERGRVITRIKDTGVGIPKEHFDKIFEPFFTTKGIGKGTGLGLSVTYGLVQDMGGQISIESTVGAGTTFTISFPVISESAGTPHTLGREPQHAGIAGGHEDKRRA